MPNVASVLKEEIARVARKEVRSETETLKKTSVQSRSEIAALKRRIVTLEKLVASLGKTKPSSPKIPEQLSPMRYSAKALSAQRWRLGLSGPEMALLLGVSPQTIYNWEAEKSRPRQQQIATIAAVRGMGKRDATARLAELVL